MVWDKESGVGDGVMLIKAAHLQPIKEPLSFIKEKSAQARSICENKQSVLCAHLHSLHVLPSSNTPYLGQ